MKTDLSSPVATVEFSKFAGILSAALSQHLLLGFEITQLEFPDISVGKESTCNVGDLLWVVKILWKREWLLTLVFWPGKFHGLYSPRGHKKLDMIYVAVQFFQHHLCFLYYLFLPHLS